MTSCAWSYAIGLLYYAIRAGMDMGIVNAGQLEVMNQIPGNLEMRLKCDTQPSSWRHWINYSWIGTEYQQATEAAAKKKFNMGEWSVANARTALVKGITDYIHWMIREEARLGAEAHYTHRGPLMDGLKCGRWFIWVKVKMVFLPQVR